MCGEEVCTNSRCGYLFRYNEKDVITSSVKDRYGVIHTKVYIVCPCCGNRIILSTSENSESNQFYSLDDLKNKLISYLMDLDCYGNSDIEIIKILLG